MFKSIMSMFGGFFGSAKIIIGGAVIFALLGAAFYWYYNQTQDRIAILISMNSKLKTAVDIQRESIDILVRDSEIRERLGSELDQKLQRAETLAAEAVRNLKSINVILTDGGDNADEIATDEINDLFDSFNPTSDDAGRVR